jgi:hypothetical protein
MQIKIPASFIPERSYLINTVFREFLGLDFDLSYISGSLYEIILSNENSIQIEDHFFSAFSDGPDYLNKKNIPEKISLCQNPFTSEQNIPVIFGIPEICVNEGTQKIIYCKSDIFADLFFMLTRWEEYVITEKDEYGRFPERLSLSLKTRIHRRPVVNEYIEMLWKMLQFLGYSGNRKKLEFEAIITHDVDEVIRYKNFYKLLRIIAGDIILRKKPGLIPITVKEYFEIKKGAKTDNYNTFDFLMDQSERINAKSHFYFLAQNKGSKSKALYSKYDFRYNIFDPAVKSIIQNIKKRGHLVGIHGSFNSFDNFDLFTEEVKNLESIAGTISESRQHYLRFLAPITWRIGSQNRIGQDGTLGFAEEIGFRCGTCFPFHVFDFIKREPLDIVEMPLTVMEGAVLFLTRDPANFYSGICSMIDIVRKYNGKFVLLWHTNCLNGHEWYPYQDYYSRIIDHLGLIRN